MRKQDVLAALSWIGAACLVSSALAAIAPPASPPPAEVEAPDDLDLKTLPPFLRAPQKLGPLYLQLERFRELELFTDDLVARKVRNTDGRPEIFLLEVGLDEYFEDPAQSDRVDLRHKLQIWQEDFPKSAFRPVVAAKLASTDAWRARGHGYARTVTPEGWKLFHERSLAAWRLLMDNRAASSRIPSWYGIALSVGLDAEIPHEELKRIFDEGVARHSWYFPLYFTWMRNYSPRWGGTFADADEFIRAQVASKNNTEGEALYARLYWVLDQYDGQDSSLFEDSAVDWKRMRKGFELLMRSFPDSEWNRANFAAYACRAGDATTYALLRPKVNLVEFQKAAPQGISLDVCDARFTKDT